MSQSNHYRRIHFDIENWKICLKIPYMFMDLDRSKFHLCLWTWIDRTPFADEY
ncbi:hypothetical protein MA16_Dca017176 [Dendrobium catenatum]|uniref:Uncharacterized protein n=1 Tax=Dendrobium catenatum TaxID=906689 RepID=A0A2I0XAQ2_9ASPA|nr:hypothetical protein MA16_Dca017176 [Dendrobium catenatum]